MKRILYLFLLLFLFASCEDEEKDSPFSSVADPEGSILIAMENRNNGATKISVNTGIGEIYLREDNNLAGYDYYGNNNWEFASAGRMKGLGNVFTIPAYGWNDKVALVESTGYVARNINPYGNCVTYLRLFAGEYIRNSNGEVIGAFVKYHVPFNGNAKEITVTKLEDVEGARKNYEYYKVEPDISWSVKSDTSWCKVSVINENTFAVYTPDNIDSQTRTAKVTVSSEGLEDVVLLVVQEEEKPVIELSTDILYFSNKTLENAINLYSTADWTITSSQPWCTVDPDKGNPTVSTAVVIYTTTNTTAEDRKATLTIKATNGKGTTETTIEIMQSGSDFQGGTGSEIDPYLIKTPLHLNNIRDYVSPYASVHFRLMNDIDMASFLTSKSNGWEPIPTFNGTLNGAGFKITNFWSHAQSSYDNGGFIITNQGNIQNLGIEIANNKAISGGSYCDYTGGIATRNASNGTIYKCYVKGIVADGRYIGGLAGVNEGNIYLSYTEGEVKNIYRSGNGYIGGIAGENNGRIENCYSKSELSDYSSSYTYLGGIAGYNRSGYIYYSYAAGVINKNYGEAGGICGDYYYSSNVQYCYYDKQVTGIDYSNAGNAKTTQEMKKQSTYEGWDFTTVWSITEGVSYPWLK